MYDLFYTARRRCNTLSRTPRGHLRLMIVRSNVYDRFYGPPSSLEKPYRLRPPSTRVRAPVQCDQICISGLNSIYGVQKLVVRESVRGFDITIISF